MTGLVGPDGSEKSPTVLGTALVPVAKGAQITPAMCDAPDLLGRLALSWRPVAGEDIRPGDQVVLRGQLVWSSR